VAGILGLQVAVVYLPVLQDFFETTTLSGQQWAVAVAVASSVLWVEEVRKACMRRTRRS
jgi:Ca2+-transporting ATPase